MKSPEDEWYTVIKDYKFTIFEVLIGLLHVHTIPTIWFTDFMIVCYHSQQCTHTCGCCILLSLVREEACKKGWMGLKYTAPNINAYVIFTAFSLKSGRALATPAPLIYAPMITYR